MQYRDGSIYDGEWGDNQRSGQGQMQYCEGDVYEGQWASDVPSGTRQLNGVRAA